MRIRSVLSNRRKGSFELTAGKQTFRFPYSRCDPRPTRADAVARVFVDNELGGEGFVYVLDSGREGTVHVEQVLEYNQDPTYMRNTLLHKLTVEAIKRLETTDLSRREIIRRLGTSATQFYRLIDPTNDRKSIDQLLALLSILDCDVDLLVRERGARRGEAA